MSPRDDLPGPLYSRFALEALEDDVRISDRMRQTIVFVGRQPPSGAFMAYGTGFVVASFIGDTTFQNVVTARHVIDKIPGDTIHLRVNTRAGDAMVVETERQHWFAHPNKNVDIAVGATLLRGDMFEILNMRLDEGLLLTDEVIAEHQIGVGDEISISGLYVSRMGEKRNLPIARSGIIAAMPEEKIKTTYGYHDAYLVETRSIDGLSGSPVFVTLNFPRFVEGHPVPVKGVAYFMGVLLGANWVRTHEDAIEISSGDVDLSEVPPTGALNTGIGIVALGHYVLEAIEQPALRGAREAAMNKPKDRYFSPDSASPLEPVPATLEPTPMEGDEQHAERFTALLDAAVGKPKQGG